MPISSSDILGQLRNMNAPLLTTMARRATRRDTLELNGWNTESLTDIDPMTNPTNGGIFASAGQDGMAASPSRGPWSSRCSRVPPA